jgi:hypothetical protein
MFQVALGTYDLAFVLGSNKGGQPRISADEHRSELAVETRALSRSSAQVPLLICVHLRNSAAQLSIRLEPPRSIGV